MPAIMDDPASPTIYRVSGEQPYPDPHNTSLPASIAPRQVTLRDRQTIATIVPFASRQQVPLSLLVYLSDQFSREVEKGDTYPMLDPMPFEQFASYWFQNFGAIMLLGKIEKPEDITDDKDWSKECLGSFYIKPNYPGRSSHVSNGGFLVTDAARNRGVGRLMGEAYLEYAPRLGYTYSVFNLVYETNVASCKIWDALGFKRIGRVKGCGNLKSYPGRLIDAIIYGRDLSVDESNEELVSEERFDKIKFYLKYGKYPNGADRAEKSRLRSAATHYKLLDGDKLMLKDKEVISDPRKQYDIARQVHLQQHGGINRSTATIAEKYHWSRIKETVSDVIRACTECKEAAKPTQNLASGNAITQRKPSPPDPNPTTAALPAALPAVPTANPSTPVDAPVAPAPVLPAIANIVAASAADRNELDLDLDLDRHRLPHFPATPYAVHHDDMSVDYPAQTLHTPTDSPVPQHTTLPPNQRHRDPMTRRPRTKSHQRFSEASSIPLSIAQSPTYQPIDPQIMSQQSLAHPTPASYAHQHQHQANIQHQHEAYPSYNSHHPAGDVETNSFQDLLAVGHHSHVEGVDDDAVDRDLDMMLIEQHEDDGSASMDVDDLGLMDHGVDHDDLSKMSVGHILATPPGPDKSIEDAGLAT